MIVLKFQNLRQDELDETVSYWCNVRTKGSTLNRQSTKLSETTTAQGVTDKFQVDLFNKMDLKSLGHTGPAKIESKVKQARLIRKNMVI